MRCEACGHNRIVNWTPKINKAREHECRPCKTAKLGRSHKGKTPASKGTRIPFNERKVGATYLDSDGYLQVYMGANHGLFGRKDQYCLLHKLVASLMNDQYDHKKHMVHHVDGDKTNNSPNNLFICQSMSHHRQVHSSLQSIAFDLVKIGVIKFDNQKQSYYLPDSGESLGTNSVNSEETYVIRVKSLDDMAILIQADALATEGATTIPLGSRDRVISKR